MTNEITVEGVTYNVSDETTYTMEPKKLYKDEYGHYVKLSAENVTYYLCSSDERWRAGHVVFPLRELLVAEKQPEWREVNNGYYAALENGETYLEAAEALCKDIAETLKASRIRIHNVDGSVTEIEASDAYRNMDMPWKMSVKGDRDRVGAVTTVTVQGELQLAFMRGSKVEVLG